MSATLTFAFLIPFALIVLLLLVIVVLVDRRDDLDPQGRRPFAAYVFVVVFLTLFTALFALAAMVNSLVHVAVGDDGSSSHESLRVTPSQTFAVNGASGSVTTSGIGEQSSTPPEFALRSSESDNARYRDAVRAGLLAAAAIGVLVFHLGLARRAADDPDVGGGRARRIYYAYLYATMTLAVIIVVGAATALGYGVFRVIAPGVASPSGVGDRTHAVPDLATSAVLLAGAGLIFWYHFRRRPTDGGAIAALPPPPDAVAPPPEAEPEPEPSPPRRAPRKAPAAKKTAAQRGPRRG